MPEVSHLRQEAPQADAVRRGHRHIGLQGGVAQCALHHALAVVETAFHTQGTHIAAEAAELVGLARGDAVVGVEDGDAHTGQVVKCRADSRTGIARGGYEDGQWTIVVTAQATKARGEKARPKVLESGGRAVKELEYVRAIDAQFPAWDRIRESLRTDGRQIVFEGVALEERLEHAQRGAGQIPVGRRQRYPRHLLGYI